MALAIGFSPFFSSGINRLLYQDDINLSKNRESSANILEENCLDERVNNIRLSVPEILNTNLLFNSSMAGATGNVLPTKWASGSVSGLTYTISSASTVQGFRSIEWTVSGTALSDGEIYLACEPMQSGSVVAQIPNEYVGSMYCAKVSGTIKAGMVLQVLTQNFANGAVQETKTKDLAAVTGQTFVRIEPNSVKTDIDSENRVNLRLYQTISGGEAIDFTIRVAAPQIEMGVTASPFISTVSGAVSEVRGRPSVLVVPQLTRQSGTNLAWHSQTWAAATNWDLSNTTTATGTSGTLDPLGTNTANAISPTTASGGHFVGSNVPTQVSFTSGTIYTQTAFLKQGTGAAGRYVQLSFATSRFSQEGYANFDLQTGALVASGGISADSNRAASIENYGNGWYRCRFTATCNGTGNQRGLFVYLITASGDTRAPSFTGVTGDVLYGWGAQLEVGSTATPYIPTTTGSVFRDGTVFPQLPVVSGADFTFTRATTATRVNASGLIESVASGLLRLDYPVTGGCPAALIEASGTNLVLQSENFTTTWAATNISVSANSTGTLDPYGTNVADLLTATASGSARVIQAFSFVSGTTYTYSCFAKAGTGFFGMTMENGGVASGTAVIWNLTTGAFVVSGTAGSNYTLQAHNIESYGNGWYRCSMRVLVGASVAGNIRVNTSNGTMSTAIIQSDSGNTAYVFGAQVETGAIPTSYIPTTTASATRAADVCTVSGVSGYIGQTEGTIYAEVDVRNINTGAFRRIIDVTDGTSGNRLQIQTNNTDSKIRISIFTAGSEVWVFTSSLTYTGITKIALAYKNNDTAYYVNGSLVSGTTSITVPATNRIQLGSTYDGASFLNDRIRAAAIYTTRLSNDVLAVMTNPEKTTWAEFVTRSSTYTELPACLETRDNQIIIV